VFVYKQILTDRRIEREEKVLKEKSDIEEI
jgi:hypothetical protein